MPSSPAAPPADRRCALTSHHHCRGGCGGRRKRSAQIWNPARAREARTRSRQLVFESIDDSRETPVETSLPSSRTWDICLLGSLCIAMKPPSFAFDYLQPAARTVWIELQVGIKLLLIVWFIHWALAPHYVWFSFIYLRSAAFSASASSTHARVVFIVTQNNQIKVVVISIYSAVITRINQAAFMSSIGFKVTDLLRLTVLIFTSGPDGMRGCRRRWWSSRSWAGCVWWLSSLPPCWLCWDGCSSTHWPCCGCGEPGRLQSRAEEKPPGSRSTRAKLEAYGASCWSSAQAEMEDPHLRPGLKACWPLSSPSSPSESTGRGPGSRLWISKPADTGWADIFIALIQRGSV